MDDEGGHLLEVLMLAVLVAAALAVVVLGATAIAGAA
jgi:hypothetical protein